MSAKNARIRARLPRATAKRQRTPRSTAARCLRAEQLEGRYLLTGTVEYPSDVNLMAVPVLFAQTPDAGVPSGVPSGVLASNQLVPPDTPDGKTQIAYLDEPFANYSGGFNGVRYVKCHILTAEPETVYFQDSVKYLFHYDFAMDRLAPFLNMSRRAFRRGLAASERSAGGDGHGADVPGRAGTGRAVGWARSLPASQRRRVDQQHRGRRAERHPADGAVHAGVRAVGSRRGGPQLVCRAGHHGGGRVAVGAERCHLCGRLGDRPAGVHFPPRRSRPRTAMDVSAPPTSCSSPKASRPKCRLCAASFP